jgi:hypothetical protein
MSVTLLPTGSQPFTGLGTWTCTVPAAGTYTLSCEATSLPSGSALQMVLSQTGSTSSSVTIGGTSTNPAQLQPAMGTSLRAICASGDVLSAILSSSAYQDALPNAVKGTITLFPNQ